MNSLNHASSNAALDESLRRARAEIIVHGLKATLAAGVAVGLLLIVGSGLIQEPANRAESVRTALSGDGVVDAITGRDASPDSARLVLGP